MASSMAEEGTFNPAFLADRKDMSCQMVAERSASRESGEYRHPPWWEGLLGIFWERKIKSIAYVSAVFYGR